MFKNDISQFRFKKESLLSILTWLFFCLTVISIIVSVESTDLLHCSSYKVRFTQFCCSLEVATTLPRDWSGADPEGAALKPPAHRLTLRAARIEWNTNWQLGLKGAALKGGEAGRLIPQLSEVRWASGGWRDEWSDTRDGVDAEGAVTSSDQAQE